MRRFAILAVAVALLAGLMVGPESTVMAGKPEAEALPKIKGHGITENFNHGILDVPDLWSIGGFNARATGPAVDGVYPAKGKIKAKAVLAGDPSTTLGRIHGTVVCIANLGPSSGVDGGGIGANDVWEIRFQVTKAKGDFSVPAGLYGSAFVQDNGKGGADFSDENFDKDALFDPACKRTPLPAFQLEPVIKGKIKVHD